MFCVSWRISIFPLQVVNAPRNINYGHELKQLWNNGNSNQDMEQMHNQTPGTKLVIHAESWREQSSWPRMCESCNA